MKIKVKGYWVIIALIIFANVAIYMFFSRHLEGLVIDYTIEAQKKSIQPVQVDENITTEEYSQ